MRVRNTSRLWLAGAAFGLALVSGNWASATPVSYTIDPTQSSLTMTGDIFSATFALYTPQVPGADVDSYGGTIAADLTAGVLTFSGGSSILAGLNPAGPFLPAAFPGTDNYGIQTVGPGVPLGPPFGGHWTIAWRDIGFDLTTGTAQHGAVPAGVTVRTLGVGNFGSIVTTSNPIPTQSFFQNQNAANSTVGLISLTQLGLVETLVLPLRRESGIGGVHTIFTGQIVATRQIPEPSTIVLAGLGVVGLALGAWRKRRAS